jgi:hypothetical protein
LFPFVSRQQRQAVVRLLFFLESDACWRLRENTGSIDVLYIIGPLKDTFNDALAAGDRHDSGHL